MTVEEGNRLLRKENSCLQMELDFLKKPQRTLRKSLDTTRKRSKPLTTNSKHSNHVCKNILDRDFVTTGPNEKWLTDITYIRIKGKSVYLSAIIDLHSRRVISWIVSHDMKTRLVVDTLKRALRTRKGIVPKQIIFHSDRGIQYTSEEFRQELERFGITQSMSGKGLGYRTPREVEEEYFSVR